MWEPQSHRPPQQGWEHPEDTPGSGTCGLVWKRDLGTEQGALPGPRPRPAVTRLRPVGSPSSPPPGTRSLWQGLCSLLDAHGPQPREVRVGLRAHPCRSRGASWRWARTSREEPTLASWPMGCGGGRGPRSCWNGLCLPDGDQWGDTLQEGLPRPSTRLASPSQRRDSARPHPLLSCSENRWRLGKDRPLKPRGSRTCRSACWCSTAAAQPPLLPAAAPGFSQAPQGTGLSAPGPSPAQGPLSPRREGAARAHHPGACQQDLPRPLMRRASQRAGSKPTLRIGPPGGLPLFCCSGRPTPRGALLWTPSQASQSQPGPSWATPAEGPGAGHAALQAALPPGVWPGRSNNGATFVAKAHGRSPQVPTGSSRQGESAALSER